MNYIDLFAGAGGLSEGFKRAGFNPIAHVEMDKAACNTLRTRVAFHYLKENDRLSDYERYLRDDEFKRADLYKLIPEDLFDSVINLPIGPEYNQKIFRKIDKLLGEQEVDLIIGGPPCQAYSLVGRARSENGMEGDHRNFLYIQYAKFLQRYKPKVFVFENVIGLKSANGGAYLENMKSLFEKKGYEIELFTVEATQFGVLQKRKRIIIIGFHEDLKFTIPNLENINSSLKYKVSSIFSDLPEIFAGGGKNKNGEYKKSIPSKYLLESGIRNGLTVLTQHFARPTRDQDKKIYQRVVQKWNESKIRLDYNLLPDNLKTHKNRTSFFDRFKVVASDLTYSQTVVAHIAKDGHYYIHPDLKQNRSITVREAARLQSFPDDYYFEGLKESSNRTAAFKQIGNAVPPLMAEKIAIIISKALRELNT